MIAEAQRERSSSSGTHRDALRICAGCKQRAGRDSLLRLVLAGQPPVLVPDVRRRAGGRGVSVHPRRACLERAVRRGAFSRAFRRELRLDVGQLSRWAVVQYERRIAGLLTGAYRARRAVLGAEAARSALRAGSVELLVVAADAAHASAELEQVAERLGEKCLVYGDKEMLGKLLGRPALAVIAVLDAAIGDELRTAAQSANGLAEAS